MSCITIRQFYYGPFKFTNGAVIACGLSYNGFKRFNSPIGLFSQRVYGEHKWDKIVGCRSVQVETATNIVDLLRDWNIQVHLWLKYYVQQRVVTPGQKPGFKETLTTFMISAFWHGFYPGYYTLFFGYALLGEISKDIYKSWILFEWMNKEFVAKFLALVLTMNGVNYVGCTFICLTKDNVIAYIRNTNGIGFIIIVLILVVIRGVGLVKIAKKAEEA